MNYWRDPNKRLPVTTGGERSRHAIRVHVEVQLSDNTQEIVQFRRYFPTDRGGAFCGFKNTSYHPEQHNGDYGEFWTEWIPFGFTPYMHSSERTVLKWRYAKKENGNA